VIASRAKEQAKKAATLEFRAKAIEHLRKALFDIENNQLVKTETVNNVRDAMQLSELVFGGEVQVKAVRAYADIQNLHQ
jgi:hypothetical protein